MDYPSMAGHGVILSVLAYIVKALHDSGIKFDFGFRIYKNGKSKTEQNLEP